jgi:two-component system response regulator HydG
MTKERGMRVLAVDGNPENLDRLQRSLRPAGYDVMTARSAAEAIGVLEFTRIDLVVGAVQLPDVDGMDLLRYARENFSDLEILMISDRPCIEEAVQSIKCGAYHYLAKPYSDRDLMAAVQRALATVRQQREVQAARPRLAHGIIGESGGIVRLLAGIDKAASINANVLIRGESGTGKELVARATHYGSERSAAPFVPVNCSAIPDSLLESELFGHVKGAFTGARESRAGFFQIADGGTVFLDEIGDASLSMQGKLLRVLQNKEINLVGSSRMRKVDTRIIAATHKDLVSMVKQGLFREDLYYRLVVIELCVPPLRERQADILLLARHFLAKFAKELDRPIPALSDGVLETFRHYSWPGNVRELENLIQRLLVIVDKGTIEVPDLPGPMRFHVPQRHEPLGTLAQVETEHIRRVLAAAAGNKTLAAEILGIDRKTLREKVKKAGLAI